jgi:hypothetical protein
VAVLSVAFDPSGGRVVTGPRVGPVRIWAVPPPPITGTRDEVRVAVETTTAAVSKARPVEDR